MTVRKSLRRLTLPGIVALIYVFMLGPILITASVSFNRSDRSYFPPHGILAALVGRGLRASMDGRASLHP